VTARISGTAPEEGTTVKLERLLEHQPFRSPLALSL
jgi:hypothetical protein